MERAQIGVDLGLQITRQEAELFTRFHGRTGKHDFFYLFAFERRHRHTNGKIRFTRTRRPYAKYYGILFDAVYVRLLPNRFALDLLASRGNGYHARRQSV